jgi:hypothetical protein
MLLLQLNRGLSTWVINTIARQEYNYVTFAHRSLKFSIRAPGQFPTCLCLKVNLCKGIIVVGSAIVTKTIQVKVLQRVIEFIVLVQVLVVKLPHINQFLVPFTFQNAACKSGITHQVLDTFSWRHHEFVCSFRE